MQLRIYLLLFLIISFFSSCNSQNISKSASQPTDKTVADFYLRFGSVCCGPTSYQPWLNFTDQFLSNENVNFYLIEKVSGLGREGEYMILLFAKDWTENQKQQYYNGLQKIQWDDQDSNTFGGVETGTNFPVKKLSEYPQATVSTVDLEYW